jgi:hypothetical protein
LRRDGGAFGITVDSWIVNWMEENFWVSFGLVTDRLKC